MGERAPREPPCHQLDADVRNNWISANLSFPPSPYNGQPVYAKYKYANADALGDRDGQLNRAHGGIPKTEDTKSPTE